jgi:predicted RNA methylase
MRLALVPTEAVEVVEAVEGDPEADRVISNNVKIIGCNEEG